jgi:hypothetical protein
MNWPGLDRECVEALLRRSVANALVWDAGAIEPETVRRLESEVVLESG